MLVQFYNAKLVTPQGVVEEGDLWVHQGRIADPKDFFWERRSPSSADRRIDCHGMLIAPGCIDIMLHEAFNVDFTPLGEVDGSEADAAAEEQLALVRRRLPELGVTAFCPAIRPCPPEVCARALARISRAREDATSGGHQHVKKPGGKREHAHVSGDGGGGERSRRWAACLGAHLDGPFFEAEHGASAVQPRRKASNKPGEGSRHIRDSLGGSALEEALGGRALGEVALLTLAPELPGALDAIERLSAAGVVVGLGRTGTLSPTRPLPRPRHRPRSRPGLRPYPLHPLLHPYSGATLTQCRAAVQHGARLVSHVLSCMPPFHHRDPGPIGLLADGAVSSDGRDQEGSENGGGRVGDQVFFSMEVANLHPATVNLAHGSHPSGLVLLSDLSTEGGDSEAGRGGSILDSALKLCETSGSNNPAAALLCGSLHPAQLLGLEHKGRLDAGADADLVLLDPHDLSVRATFVRGLLAWSHPELHGALWFHA